MGALILGEKESPVGPARFSRGQRKAWGAAGGNLVQAAFSGGWPLKTRKVPAALVGWETSVRLWVAV